MRNSKDDWNFLYLISIVFPDARSERSSGILYSLETPASVQSMPIELPNMELT